MAARNVGTRTSDPISLPRSAKSTSIDATSGRPRESNGHIVRRFKVDDQRETEVLTSVVESCGLSPVSRIGSTFVELPSILSRVVAHSFSRESCVAMRKAWPRVRKVEISLRKVFTDS